jgi:CheY-like chemotaxis protein
MKLALVLEKDSAACANARRLLSWLGYTTVSAQTPRQALNSATTVKFDIFLICTAEDPDDRRSFSGELKRAAPDAAVVLIAEKIPGKHRSASWCSPGISAVLERPVSVDALRRIVEFGIDGCGLQSGGFPQEYERRNKLA